MARRGRSPGRGRSPEKKSKQTYQNGDKVMALWPGSSLYYPAVVQGSSGGRYTVRFENDATATVSGKQIMSINAVKKSSSRSRSRSRSRSPSRRARSRSPARQKTHGTSSPRSDHAGTPRKRQRPSTPVRKSARLAQESLPAATGVGTENDSTVPMAAKSGDLPKSDRSSGRYEFLGPAGVAGMMLGLPFTVVGLYLACNKNTCNIREITDVRVPSGKDLWDSQSFFVVLGWLTFIAGLSQLPIGRVVYGRTLQNGTKLAYRLNGFFVFLMATLLFGASLSPLGLRFGIHLPVGWVYDHYLHLATASGLVALLLAVFLYLYSFRNGALLASGGNTGNPVYDFFVGRELNPRVGSFDLKFFCELRPGLIGWVLINFCLAWKQYELHGSLSNSMILVCFFQFLYVADGLYAEEAILTTMDIIHDGFGFMLAYGDLGWVPFVYTLQARYLVDRPVNLPYWAVATLLLINMVGFLIFRFANGQKDEFRRDPHSPGVQHLRTIPTSSGKSLLADGWWGMCRHPNYLGDLMMGFAWCATCGIQNIIPYFYFIYFLILLIHRQRRDDIHCRVKYGAAWDEYERQVPYRIFPGIY